LRYFRCLPRRCTGPLIRFIFNENEETQELITDNYTLMRKVAKSVEYQYVLNLNYTIFRF